MGSNLFFTSDTHFRHPKILQYQRFNFSDLEAMEEFIIDRWNATVKKTSTIYHLGDFAFSWDKDQKAVEKILSRLNGHKHLILGNHDREAVRKARGWCSVNDYKKIKHNGQKIILFHYPIISWNGLHHGTWHLHGHSHGNLVDDGRGKIMDVGVDPNDFTPVSFEDVGEFMSSRPQRYVDHHIGNEVAL